MQQILLTFVKIATALTTLAMAFLTGWSLFTGKPAGLTVTALLLTAAFGFFSYTDAKKLFNK